MFSQTRTVTGRVLDETEDGLPAVTVLVKNTDVKVFTNTEGRFSIQVPDSSSVLLFRFLGYYQYEYQIVWDREVEITLEPQPTGGYYHRWSIGPRFDPLNNLFGLTVGNVYDEETFIHFEEVGTNYFFKVRGESDFDSDYRFSGQVAVQYPLQEWFDIKPFFHRVNFDFSLTDLKSQELSDKNVGFSLERYLYVASVQAGLSLREFQGDTYWGANIGLRKRVKRTYFGLNLGIYDDFTSFSAFVYQRVAWNLYLRGTYERVSSFDFLRFGINLTFEKPYDKNAGYHRLK